MTPFAETTIATLARALDRADEQTFRQAAETAIAALPTQRRPRLPNHPGNMARRRLKAGRSLLKRVSALEARLSTA